MIIFVSPYLTLRSSSLSDVKPSNCIQNTSYLSCPCNNNPPLCDFTLQHTDSEGALLGDKSPLKPAACVRTLGPSPEQSEMPRVQEELGRRRHSLEPLCPRAWDSKPVSFCREGPEQEEAGMNTEDILMEEDQASVEDGPPESSTPKIVVMEPIEDYAPVNTESPPTEPPRQLETSEPEETCTGGVHEEESYREEEESYREEEESYREEEESYREEEEESDCSALHPDEIDSSVTNGDCSELGEMDETLGAEPDTILPTSVLDQASIIAEHFVGRLSRRGSFEYSEDLPLLGCPSPQLLCQTDRTLYLNADLQEKTQIVVNSIPEPPLQLEADPSMPAPTQDHLIEIERGSTLSNQDRVLIHKIRTYYEQAEHQDASFSIKRRESLSYIPPGLVRQLSRQLNSKPWEQVVPGHQKLSPNNRPSSWSVFDLPGLGSTSNNPMLEPHKAADTSSSSQLVNDAPVGDEVEFFRPSSDMVQVWQDMEMVEVSGSLEEHQDVQRTENIVNPRLHLSRITGTTIKSPETENIKPLKCLDEAAMDIVSEDSPDLLPSTNSSDITSEQDSFQNKTLQSEERLRIAPLPRITSMCSPGEEDLILQDMERMKNKVFQLARQYSQRIRNSRPMVKQRNREAEKHLTEKDLPVVYEEKVQRGRPNLTLSLKSYEQVIMSELRSPSPALSLDSGASSQVTSPCPHGPHSPVQTGSFLWPDVQELRSKYTNPRLDPGSCHSTSVSRSCSIPERIESCTEGFGTPRSPTGSSSSCNNSKGTISGQTAFPETKPSVHELGQGSTEQSQLSPPLCRWNSLDHMLGTLPLHELQNLQKPMRSSYLAGQATLLNEQTVIVVEKVPGARLAETGRKERIDEQGAEGLNFSKSFDYQHCAKISALNSGKKTEGSLVKNLRAKFQNLGSFKHE
ncbi:hypothetical protein UPYG_G00223630 [Umbra pygmaea]|uniref:Uncharacterized protein n=1 Tax=Umbra pygmaea TaxID=75934 RepID=A0ABD0WZU2_UMBPY